MSTYLDPQKQRSIYRENGLLFKDGFRFGMGLGLSLFVYTVISFGILIMLGGILPMLPMVLGL